MPIITDFLVEQTKNAHSLLKGYRGYMFNVIDTNLTNLAVADTVQLFKVEDGMIVDQVQFVIITAEGGAATLSIGDDTDPNGFDDSVDANAASNTVTSTLEADAFQIGRFYRADNTIDLYPSTALSTLKALVIASYVRAPRRKEITVPASPYEFGSWRMLTVALPAVKFPVLMVNLTCSLDPTLAICCFLPVKSWMSSHWPPTSNCLCNVTVAVNAPCTSTEKSLLGITPIGPTTASTVANPPAALISDIIFLQ